MRTNEERIAAMHACAAEIERTQRAHRVRIIQSAGAAVSFAAVILLAVFMPRLASFEQIMAIPTGGTGSANDMHASMLYESGAEGYVVIAVVAFLLGAAVTAFCFRLKQWQEEKDKNTGL